MNSVAIPATAASSAPSTEAELVRRAARGDAEAFSEIYRRHSQPAWRLAQAVAPDRDAAITSFADGLVRAVRGRATRRGVAAGQPFRPAALASVYRSAIDQAYDRSAPPSGARRAPSPEAALADAAFRSLPERWRAAVWLSEVENLDTERVATVLGVSVPVAAQLVARGRRGLAGRYAQARHDMPPHIGEVLRPLALAMPATLAETTRARWAAAGSERAPVLAPVSGWIEDRGLRPMAVAAGALIGLGLIGLGVVPQGSSVRAALGAASADNPDGTLPVHTCDGLTCPAGASAAGLASGAGSANGDFLTTQTGYPSGPGGGLYGAGSGGYGSGSYTGSGAYAGSGGGGAGSGYAGGTVPGGASGGGSTGGTTTGGGTAGGGTTGGGTTGGGTTGGGTTGGGTTGGGGGTTNVVNLAPVASVTRTGSTGSVNLLPTSSGGSTASVSGGSGGVGVSVGGTPVLTTPPTTVAPTTTTTTTPLGGVVGGLTTTVGGVVGSLTGGSTTTTTLIGGL